MEPRTIRPATRDDVPALLGLIRELAEYERLAHEAVATEQGIHDGLFGPRPAAEALVCVVDGHVAGFALFFPTFSTFQGRPGTYLEDLYVRPAHRGNGHGRALLAEVARVADARGHGRLEWSVLDWNEPAIRFYRALGAHPLAEWTRYRLADDALTRLAASGPRGRGGPSP